MLYADLMVRTDDGSLEQTPDAFQRVCVNDAGDPFLFLIVKP